jgi:hypothetical protein
MILPTDVSQLDAYPTDWTKGGPWVMWKGTPYAHIMVPPAEEEGRRQEIDLVRPAGRVAALLLTLALKSGGHAILILESERGE